MARRLRSNREDGWYHVFHRGHERREVFRDDRDREHFLELLGLFARRGGTGKPLAMWAARRFGGLTLRETGAAVGGLDYAAVSIAVKRLVRQAATNPTLRAQMQRVESMLSVET